MKKLNKYFEEEKEDVFISNAVGRKKIKTSLGNTA